MRKHSLLFLAIMGCAGAGGGVGEVRSTEDAPWSMDAATTFLWNASPDNDGSSGQGALFIAVAELRCSELGQTARGVRERDRGLVFRLGYATHKDPSVDPPSWDGIYMTGGADSMGQVVVRSLEVESWKDGSIYGIDSESWVRIDEGLEKTFRGSFVTPWWSGSFNAEVCPESTSGDGDTGDE